MRLLFVVHYPVFGGPHNEALRLAAPLRAQGWDTTVLLPDEPGNAAMRLRAGGVDVVQMPLGRLRALLRPGLQLRFATGIPGDVQRIRALIRERDIDLVLVTGLVNPQAAIAARLEGVPVIWHIVDTRAHMALRRLAMPVVLRLSDVVMTTGRAVARAHPGTEVLGERLIPYFSPVDCALFRPMPELRETVRAGWRLGPDDFVLGSVGNINPMKGIEQLIEALALVRKQRPEARLVLIGAEYDSHAAYSLRLRRLIDALGIEEGRDVVFAGARSDVERQLQGIDVFVMGSVPRSEGAPTSIMEAMACGLPVVATDVGSVSEQVVDGETGYVVPPLNPRALASAVLRVAEEPGRREAMGGQAVDEARRRFATETCVSLHLEAFELAMGHRGQARAA